MSDDSPQRLSEIHPDQLTLIDQLDVRQDEVLSQLDELTLRIEQLIERYVENRRLEQDSDDSRQAA